MKRYVLIVTMMLVTQWCVATSFRVPRLAKIATAVHLQVTDSLLCPDVELDSIAFFNGMALYIRTDGFGDVSQIGYRLFPKYIKDTNKDIPIFDFLERYLLELDLHLDGKSVAQRMDIDQVVVTNGTLDMLYQLNSQKFLQVNIEEIPRKMYRLNLQIGEKVLIAVIPTDSQLLFGGNILELEQAFIGRVNRMITVDNDALINNWDAVITNNRNDYMVIDGGFYRIEDIRGDIYLTQRKGNRQLLMDRKSPMHSVSNMMLTGLTPQNVHLQVDYHVYGNKINHQQVSLQQFVDYCKSEKCKLYFGTKTLTDTEITGTLFAYNEKYAYTHMLSVTIPLDILEGAQSQITGHAYVYIPLHDITEKYIRPIDF